MTVPESRTSPANQSRSIRALVRPLEELAHGSEYLFTAHLTYNDNRAQVHTLPKFLFAGPGDRRSYLRVGIFAGIHGDEESGILASIEFLERLHANPEKARGYEGILSAPPGQKPWPFEIVFETPHLAPVERQVEAHIAALETILDRYRALISEAQNI